MNRIVVIGGINMDLHLFGLEGSAGQAPLIASHYLAQPGGKGANVARAVARLGTPVRLIARTGDDEFGRHCVKAISDGGVDTSWVAVSDGSSTGFVAIELVDGRHRSLLFAPGANDALSWSDVEPGLRGIGAGDILITQGEVPAATLTETAAFALDSGAALYLDPTPPERIAAGVLAAADVITPDLVEAAALVGRANTSSLWPVVAARELLTLGARRVLIKTGPAGAVLADDSGTREIPTLSVSVVDETGAGDVFLAALAVGRAEGRGWEEATLFANVASALSVAGAGLTLPDRVSVDAAMAGLDGGPGEAGQRP